MSLITMVGIAATLVPLQTGGDLIKKHVSTLTEAGTIRVKYTVELIPAAPETYELTFSKPNNVRIDGPRTLIVSDGKTIWEYSKVDNEYTAYESNSKALAELLNKDEYLPWAAFFMPEVLKGTEQAKLGGKMSMFGNPVVSVEFGSGSKMITLYIDEKLGIARGGSFRAAKTGEAYELVIKARELSLGDKVDSGLFAFSPPSGAKKVEMATGDLAKWYYNLDEALKVAKQTNRMVFLDFNATWCGPCQMYKRNVFPTAEFKAMAKYFVFCDIDTDEQPALARQYGVSGIPDLRFLTKDGREVHKVVGYKGMALLADMEKARQMAD